MSYVLTPAPTVAVPVLGGGEFPVHRIYCVGRNYAEHAQEMGFTGREPPFFFMKPAGSVHNPYRGSMLRRHSSTASRHTGTVPTTLSGFS